MQAPTAHTPTPDDELQTLLDGLTPEERDTLNAAALDFTRSKRFIPNPGPQTEAYFSEADEIFYGGAAGGGKTALLCGLAIEEHTKAIIFRREFPQIKSLIDEVHKLVGSRENYHSQDKLWKLSPTKELEFGSCQYEEDKEKYQGRAHDFKGFDEITGFTESQYTYLIGWTRTTLKNQRTRVFCTGNPPTSLEGRWVIKRWAAWLDPAHPNPAKPGELRWYLVVNGEEREVNGPGPHPIEHPTRGLQQLTARSRTFIAARLEDNPYLMDTGYAATLEAMPEPLRTMMREGRFDMAMRDDAYQLIPSAWVDAAQQRWRPRDIKGQTMTAMALDPAGGGADASTLAFRYDDWVAPLVQVTGKSTADGAATLATIVQHRRGAAPVVIDVGGGYAGALMARMDDNGIPYHKFNGSEATNGKTRDKSLTFANKRAHAWWALREALDPEQEGGATLQLPPDPAIRADLCAPTFAVAARGIIIEDKTAIRKRLGRSPDRGDALAMCLHEGAEAVRRGLTRSNVIDLPTRANVSRGHMKRYK